MKVLLFVALFAATLAEAQDLSRLLSEHIRSQFPKGSRIQIEKIRPAVSGFAHRIESVLPSPALGLISFDAVDKKGGRIGGTAYVRVWTKIAVVKTPLSHHQAIHAEHVSFEEREIASLGARSYFTTAEDIEGRSAKGFIRAGQALGINNTEMPFDVETGSHVELVSKRGSLVVAAKVRAIDSGRRGDVVRVESLSSKKLLRAKVTGPQTVEVN